MALKAIVKSLDGLNDETKKLYVKKDDAYHLDLEDLPEDPKLAEFRESNRKLSAKTQDLTEMLKKFDGIDVEKVKELQETDKKLKEKKLIDTGKLDELRETWLTPLKQEFTTQIETMKKENQELREHLATLKIDEQIMKIGTGKGITSTAIEDVVARGRKIFTLKDGHAAAVAQDGTTILDKQGNPITMETWLDSLATTAPHFFKSSNGGGANGNNGNGSNGKTMKRSDWEKLDMHAQREYVTIAKGTLVD